MRVDAIDWSKGTLAGSLYLGGPLLADSRQVQANAVFAGTFTAKICTTDGD
jgi:hypothetical protein